MIGERFTSLLASALRGTAVLAVWLAAIAAFGQAPEGTTTAPPRVVDVRIVGCKVVNPSTLPKVGTRAGQEFDPQLIEEDKRTFAATGKFLDVQPKIQEVPGGIVVFFEVVEKPLIGYVKYVGNKKIKDKALNKQTMLESGSPLDPYAVEDGRRKIEQYYRDRGYNDVEVEIGEGNEIGDPGVVYLISEGLSEKVRWTRFEGNTIASDARLRTQIQTKPGFMWLFKGYVDEKKLDEDVDRLTAYYRSLGFFQAQIGRPIRDESGRWTTFTFVINEGPRYVVRSVKFIGNEKFGVGDLVHDLHLKEGMPYDQIAMAKDIAAVKDVYGSHGYVFADVKPEQRFGLEPGYLDLEYNITEGQRYRVGRIYVTIAGENPRTRESVVRNRLSLRTGDIVDTRKLRDSERRLKASGLFMNDPITGTAPKIVFSQPETDEQVAEKPKKGSNFRGQSPDGPALPVTDIHYYYASREQFFANHPDAQLGPVEPARTQTMRPRPQPQSSSPVHHSEPHVPVQAPPAVQPNSHGQAMPSPAAPPQAAMIRAQSPGLFNRAPATIRGQNTYGGTAVGAIGPEHRAASYPQIAAQQQTGQQQAYGTPMARQVTPVQYTQPATPAPYRPGEIYLNGQPGNGSVVQQQGQPQYGPQPQYGGQPQYGAQPQYPVQQPLSPPVDANGNVAYQFLPGPEAYGGNPMDDPFLDLYPEVSETQTGRIMFGVGINSDAGLVGNVVIDEQNFDISRLPSSWEDVRSGRAFRGAGQRFRLEAAPGTEVQRYVISFGEPYLFNSQVGYSISASYYERRFRDWDEERVALRQSLSYQLRPDLTLTGAIRAEEITITDPRVPTPPELAEVVGDNELYGFKAQLTHDTRDSPFLPTEGHIIELAFEQVIGTFDYPRETIEARQYFLMRQRPDGSGRHVLSMGGQLGFSGSDTPLYDHFFAGGYSTLRGFDFRGASPKSGDVIVGGEFQLLGTVEYMFPITADDMLKGVAFVDFGTVEEKIRIDADDFRVAPGVGLRITVPALGPAPIALDLAFPIADEEGDDRQVFSFFVGALR